MEFTIDKKDKYTLIKLQAEKLDTHVAPSLKSELVLLNTDGVKNLVIDLGETRYCDSSGLSSILVANRLCKNAGGTMVLCNVQEQIMKLISISQLDSILNIIPTVKEAEDFIVMEEVERDINKNDNE